METTLANIKDLAALESAIKISAQKGGTLSEEVIPEIFRLKEQGLLNADNCSTIGIELINGTNKLREAGNPYAAVAYSLALEGMCTSLGIDSSRFQAPDLTKVSCGSQIFQKLRKFFGTRSN